MGAILSYDVNGSVRRILPKREFSRNDAVMFADLLQNVTGRGKKRSELPTEDERFRQARFLTEAVQAYLAYADEPSEMVQAFISSTDLPQPVGDALVFRESPEYDDGWSLAFMDASNRIQPGTDYWEVATLSQGSTWQVVPEGAEVQVRRITGDLAAAKVKKYGDGIAISDELIRFRKIGPMLDLLEDFRDGYARGKSNGHYQVLTASAFETRPFVDPGGTNLEADIATFNDGALALLERNKDRMPVGEQTQILAYCPPRFRDRISRAMGELSQSFAGSTRRVVYNVRPIYSFNANLPPAAPGETFAALFVIPRGKIHTATLMDPGFMDDTDILSLSFLRTGFSYWGAYNFAPEQVLVQGFK